VCPQLRFALWSRLPVAVVAMTDEALVCPSLRRGERDVARTRALLRKQYPSVAGGPNQWLTEVGRTWA